MATYYISTTGTNSAGRNGSVGQEWLTLSYAVTRVTTVGDIIYVNTGTYTEPNQVNVPAGVSIQGAGDTSILILTHQGTNLFDFAMMLASTDNATHIASISYLQIHGNSLAARNGIFIYGRSGVSVHHCTIHDFQFSGVYFDSFTSAYCYNNSFHDNNIYNCSTRAALTTGGGYGCGLLQIAHQSGITIYNNTFNQTQRADGQNGNCIYGVNGHHENMKIYGNTFTKPENETLDWNFCIELFYLEGGIEIYNNEFIGGGQHIDSGQSGTIGSYLYCLWVHNNIFRKVNQHTTIPDQISIGVDIELAHSKCIVEKNIFKNLGIGVELDLRTNNSTMDDIKIRNNLFINCGFQNSSWDMVVLISGEPGFTGMTFSNIYFQNNIIASNSSAVGKPSMGIHVESVGTVNGLYIQNNVFRDIVDYAYLVFRYNTGTYQNITISNNNVYHCANTNNHYLMDSATVSNLTVSNAIHQPSLFVDENNFNFNLQSTSLNVNAGTNVGITSDYIGNSVPSGSVSDIGAYEYQSVVIGNNKYFFALLNF